MKPFSVPCVSCMYTGVIGCTNRQASMQHTPAVEHSFFLGWWVQCSFQEYSRIVLH